MIPADLATLHTRAGVIQPPAGAAPHVVMVCGHGAAKSLIATADFNNWQGRASA